MVKELEEVSGDIVEDPKGDPDRDTFRIMQLLRTIWQKATREGDGIVVLLDKGDLRGVAVEALVNAGVITYVNSEGHLWRSGGAALAETVHKYKVWANAFNGLARYIKLGAKIVTKRLVVVEKNAILIDGFTLLMGGVPE